MPHLLLEQVPLAQLQCSSLFPNISFPRFAGQTCVNYLKHKGLILYQVERCANFRDSVTCDGELKETSRKNKK